MENMREPFWCEYVPPASNVAAEVQRPAYLVNGYTLAVAYQKDAKVARRPARNAEAGK